MKKSSFMITGCILLCTSMITGCSLFGAKGLDRAYSYEDRTGWQSSSTLLENGRAGSFAQNLCVVTDENAYKDSSVNAEAAVVFDVNDSSVVYSKNAFEKLYPASTTKIMTALVALKYGNLSDMVTVTDDAVITESGASLCEIKPGDMLTLEQLLYGLMLPSGNDAGAAIAVHIAGSVDAFADMMNEEAKTIGATGTHFVNPHGLQDRNHYTTAYDLYLMFNEAIKYPKFREIIGSTVYDAQYKDKTGNLVEKTWKGGNWYMVGEKETPDGLKVFGGKTGTTSAAGYCLVMGSTDDQNKEYISIVMQAASRTGLYDNMTKIIRKIVD